MKKVLSYNGKNTVSRQLILLNLSPLEKGLQSFMLLIYPYNLRLRFHNIFMENMKARKMKRM